MAQPNAAPQPQKKTNSEGIGFVKKYWNPKAQKWMIAEDYGYKAWPFGGKRKP